MTKDEAMKLALGALVYFHLYAEGEKEEALAEEALTALREALADQPAQQEPVAWMVYTKDGQSVYVTDNPTAIQADQRALPLYTSPPAQRTWVGLSDEESTVIWANSQSVDEAIRATEKQLMENNI